MSDKRARWCSAADYDRVASEYLSFAQRTFGDDLIAVQRCGEVAEPGISDLDLLVVVRDYELANRRWWDQVMLLNPERLSRIVVHGPFLCSETDLPGLHSFTTIRGSTFWSRDGWVPPPVPERAPDALNALCSQAPVLAHIGKALRASARPRHRLLLLRALSHSYLSMEPHLREAGVDVHRYREFRRTEREVRRGVLAAPVGEVSSLVHDLTHLGVRTLETLIRDIGTLLDLLYLRGELGSPASPHDPEAAFSALVAATQVRGRTATGAESGGNPIVPRGEGGDRVRERMNFIRTLLDRYMNCRLLEMGAEFPFILGDAAGELGGAIWRRRAIKALVRSAGSLAPDRVVR